MIYFPGNYGTKGSRSAFDRLIGEYLANGRRLPSASTTDDITVAEVIAAYWKHCEGYYSSSETDVIKMALRPLNRLYGSTRAVVFGPLALKAIQSEMVGLGWSRGVINKQIVRIRQMFKWAVANEMIPPAVHQALTALPGLKRGKTDAREPDPVRPVPQPYIDAILPIVSPIVADMIRLQLLTGARPGEICKMKVGNIDTADNVWICRPAEHKTAHRGHAREIRIGPQAQEIAAKYLKPDIGAYLFSPEEAEQRRRDEQRRKRNSPLTPSQIRRAELARKRKRK
jgi:integrase